MPGTLYLVPTPIGNLDDITLRALKVLAAVDVVAAEDTRHTGQLLHHFQLKKVLVSYQEHNELQRIPELIQRLLDGQSIALVSDAGTPALSDPGFKLIREVIRARLSVESLPGASSILVALTGSGLPTDKFFYGGFLPRTSSKRQSALREVATLIATLVYFESPHRIAATLADAAEVLGDRPVVIARELTKIHQEYWRGSLVEAVPHFAGHPVKGEIVLLLAGANR
jgi:16S rRNA (cytidine1402-2'-O)-methyltransferase